MSATLKQKQFGKVPMSPPWMPIFDLSPMTVFDVAVDVKRLDIGQMHVLFKNLLFQDYELQVLWNSSHRIRKDDICCGGTSCKLGVLFVGASMTSGLDELQKKILPISISALKSYVCYNSHMYGHEVHSWRRSIIFESPRKCFFCCAYKKHSVLKKHSVKLLMVARTVEHRSFRL